MLATRVPGRRTAATIRALEYHLEHIDVDRCGYGPDEYAPDRPAEHAMAYALYARGLVGLACASGDFEHLALADRVADRLEELRGPEGAWGLPFDHRGLPAGHPFAVTTAVAVQALVALAEARGGDPGREPAIRAACDWLAGGLEWETGARYAAPWYAPEFPLIAPNVAAHVAAALVQAGALADTRAWEERAAQALRFVRDEQQEAGYWVYARGDEPAPGSEFPPSAIVDSIHSAYTIDGLVAGAGGCPGVSGLREAATAGVEFLARNLQSPDGCLRERAIVADEADERTARLLGKPQFARRYLPGGRWLLDMPAEARLWSYGAALGALSRAADAGCCSLEPAAALAARVSESRLAAIDGRMPYRRDDPRAFPRHEAHAFEGLAAFACSAEGVGASIRPRWMRGAR